MLIKYNPETDTIEITLDETAEIIHKEAFEIRAGINRAGDVIALYLPDASKYMDTEPDTDWNSTQRGRLAARNRALIDELVALRQRVLELEHQSVDKIT